MDVELERLRLPVSGGRPADVTAAVHRPANRTGRPLLLTHGAGNDLDTRGLVALAEAAAVAGHMVVRCNLPYRELGARRAPPPAERSVPAYTALLTAARERLAPDVAWLAGGKSYGGRVASLAAAAGMDVAGLVFYGYPLHPPGKPERLRSEHWPDVTVPCLFLAGTHDPFCDRALLERELPRLAGPATVHVVEGGDHSLRVTAKAAPDGIARSDTAVMTALGGVVTRWARALA